MYSGTRGFSLNNDQLTRVASALQGLLQDGSIASVRIDLEHSPLDTEATWQSVLTPGSGGLASRCAQVLFACAPSAASYVSACNWRARRFILLRLLPGLLGLILFCVGIQTITSISSATDAESEFPTAMGLIVGGGCGGLLLTVICILAPSLSMDIGFHLVNSETLSFA